ncbi:MAG: hypothetical protein WA446_05530 [Steroidobacteraceae bacterium]
MSGESDDTTELVKLDLPVKPTVLIVDDDNLVLARLQKQVVAAGFEMRTAAGGVAQTTVFATPPSRGAIPVVRRLVKTLGQSWFFAPEPTIRSERRSLRGLTNGDP